jgi:hypothetical protein
LIDPRDIEAVVHQLTEIAWDAVVAAYEHRNIHWAEHEIERLREGLREVLTVIHEPPAGTA